MRKKLLYIGLSILLLVILTIVAYLFYFKSATSDQEQLQTTKQNLTIGSLEPIPIDKIEDTSRKREGVISANGGVISTEFSDGTKAYLVYPKDAFLVPWTVSIAPLTKAPLEGYPAEGKFYGVSIGSPDYTVGVQKDSWLVIDMRADKSLPEDVGARLGPCRFEFKYFNPILCASENNVPLGFGVDPEEIVFGYDFRYKRVQHLYTYPIGEPNVVVARIYRNGAYFFNEVDKELGKKLAEVTLEKSSSYENRLGAAAHVLASGETSEKVARFVLRLGKSVGLDHRESLQAANIATFLDKKDTAKTYLQKFDKDFGIMVRDVKSFGSQWAEYSALARSYNLSLKNKKFSAASSLSPQLQQDDPRLIQAIKGVVSKQKSKSSGSIDAESVISARQALTQLKKGKEEGPDETDDELDALIGASIVVAGKYCRVGDLLDILQDPSISESQTELALDEISRCLKEELDKAKTKGEALEVAQKAEAVGDSDLKKKALQKAEKLPVGTCDLTKKNLANFGKNDCP